MKRQAGVKFKCAHGRQRSQCKDCGGGGICEHGRKDCARPPRELAVPEDGGSSEGCG